VTVERYPRSARRYHAAVYLATLLLLATGWWLLAGREGDPSPLALVTGVPDVQLHVWLGWALVIVAIAPLPFALRGIATFVRETLRVDPGDLRWLRRWPLAVFSGRFPRHEGHFDPGQRLANVAIVALLATLMATGVALVFIKGGPAFAFLATVHRLATIAFTIVIAGHILIAAGILPGYRGAWRAMHLGGRLRFDTARRLWPGWTERRTVNAASMTRVVIVGGGFAGLNAAKRLARRPVELTVIDRENYHLFQPLLYQVATAALSPGDIAQPIRHVLGGRPNLRVLQGDVRSVDLAGRRIALTDGTNIKYDRLVLATGARHRYFEHPEWEAYAPGLKTLDDALEVRRRILTAFEAAERTSDPAQLERLLTFVVVGGGPTGVELAGAIAEIARHTLAREFRAIDTRQARVVLCEHGSVLLKAYPPRLSAHAERALRRMGVDVRTGTSVLGVSAEGVKLATGTIPSATVLWAAGVDPSPLGRALGVPTDAFGRVPVEPDLTLAGHPEVYVLGDLASVADGHGRTLPALAPVAIQEGRTAADNIWRSLSARPARAFRYRDRGMIATIGRASAIGRIGPFNVVGSPAWLAWLFVHIVSLIGLRNRLSVLLGWTWSYLAWQDGARIITRRVPMIEQNRFNDAGRPGASAETVRHPPRANTSRRPGIRTWADLPSTAFHYFPADVEVSDPAEGQGTG
jgi:NADH dehydrogenase